jgi:PAS domain S-box-containing protein
MAERKNGNLTPVFYTSAVERMLGYTSEDFLGKKFLWFRIIHPKDRTMVLNQLRAAYADPARENAELEYRAVNRKGNILWIRNKININRAEDESIISVVGLVSDITLSKRAEEELKRSAEELRTLNESKDRFISIISHDLRTPFSSILGYTDMLLGDRQLPEEKQVEYTLYIQESAKNMLELVNALLDWTRLQTGRIKFETKRLEANVLANKSISMLNGTAMQKNINLVSSIDRQTLIHADESLMLQAFNNLVSNAIKFTKPGGNITISAEQLPEEHLVRFSVKDSGVGIRKEDMDKLFRVDSKFTSPGTAGEKGTGLGLSLVREIVEKHGGKIWVKSKIGHGTEFLFTIPVSSTTIMIVDDILTDRILYTKLIHSIMPEYIIKDAPHGKAAFEAIKSISPLLVITEHKMPLMSGYELVKQVQLSDEINFKPAFIILSRKLNKSIISSYKELGLKYIFSKPVDLDQFRLAINNSLKEALVS